MTKSPRSSVPEALAVVGHELRSPLAALMISADILADEIDTLDRQARADVLGAIQRRTRALHTLVDNLLHSAGRLLTLEYQTFAAEHLIAPAAGRGSGSPFRSSRDSRSPQADRAAARRRSGT